jgi:DNA invertase Pin-like site-specific DNA recombinase
MNPMTQPQRAAAYYRMSDDRQETSLERQRSLVEPYAARQNYTLLRGYTDEGIPGDEEERRTGFMQMLKDAQRGAFEIILCDDKDRFGRFDSITYGYYVKPLRDAGVRLVTVAQGEIDWNSFAGRVSDAVLQEAKNIESEALSRRVLSGQLLKARLGKSTGGRTTYGYRSQTDGEGVPRLVPDGRKADVVRLVFRLYDQGQTLYAIADELYRRGVASPRGNSHWRRSVLQRLLHNRRYCGDWTWGVHPQGKRHRYGQTGLEKATRGKRGPRRNPATSWIVLLNTHEPLVDRDQFERVQARLADNQKQVTPHPGGGSFALNRLLVCTHCGSFLCGTTQYDQRKYICGGYLAHGPSYCKRHSVAEEPILRFLLKKLQQTFLAPTYLAKLRKEIRARAQEEQSPANKERLERQAATLADQIRQGNERLLFLPPDRLPGVIELLRTWEREREHTLDQLRHLQTHSPVDELERTIADAEALLWQLQEALSADDLPRLRQLLREMIDHIDLEWTHRPHGRRTRATLKGGTVWLRASPELHNMSPLASQSHY